MSHVEPPTGPQSDPFVTMPSLVPLRSAVEAADWAATRTILDELSADDLSFAVGVVSEMTGVQEFLERAAAEHPEEALARTLVAARYVVIGWGVRSGARARYVSGDRFAVFHDWLRRAELILIEVCAEHPAYALAWSWRLRTARGLELGRSEARRRYDRLAAHHPHDFTAQRQLLQQLCPKWSGSWEAVHEFSRTCVAAAPQGSPVGALIADAHLEHWLDLPRPTDADHLREIRVRDELVAAAEASVWHPDFEPGFQALVCHGLFAATLSLGGHWTEAARHFRVLGDRYSTRPWEYLGDAESEFVNHRTTALARG